MPSISEREKRDKFSFDGCPRKSTLILVLSRVLNFLLWTKNVLLNKEGVNLVQLNIFLVAGPNAIVAILFNGKANNSGNERYIKITGLLFLTFYIATMTRTSQLLSQTIGGFVDCNSAGT